MSAEPTTMTDRAGEYYCTQPDASDASAAKPLASAFRTHQTLGIPDIDAEHEVLFRMLDELQELARSHQRALLPKSVRLIEHLREHFEREEELMRESAYPAIETHIAAHKVVIEETGSIAILAEPDHIDGPSIELCCSVIHTWFRMHVADHDAPMAAFLRSRAHTPASKS